MASGLYDMEDDDIDEFRLDAPFLDHRIPSSFDTQTGTFLQAPEIGETLHQEGNQNCLVDGILSMVICLFFSFFPLSAY
jgi:hypothetical protein